MKTRASFYNRATAIIQSHPLAFVLVTALLFRTLAVIFSKGFLYSDDYYETVGIVYEWLQHGIFSSDGLLTWRNTPASDISRFPLYTLFLYCIMKLYYLCGINSLDTMMYGIRAAHAMLSLITVLAIYGIIKQATKSTNWALIGGLAAAVHFALPMFGVRTLIEVVGGHFWVLSLFLIYLSQNKNNDRLLFWAGVVAGLGWMIRFELVIAIAVVPLLLWWQSGRIRQGVWYATGFGVMLFISGIVDYKLLGGFLSSSLNHVHQGVTELPPYSTSALIYLGVILTFFIPPFSAIFLLAGYKRFWSQHKVLVFSSLAFIITHNFIASRQERYMLPIIPALLALLILIIHWQIKERGYLYRHKRLFTALAGFAVIVNVTLLPIITGTYGHKGIVAPLVYISKIKQPSQVMFVTPERSRIFPFGYAGYKELKRFYIYRWQDLKNFDNHPVIYSSTDFFICYPNNSKDISAYMDSLALRTDSLQLILHTSPTILESILHFANPKHNPTNEAWVFGHAGEQ